MLSEWSHPISELVLADCGINGKMLQTLFNALNKNPAMSISIQHLDLSGNKFELAGTQALDSWFATLKVYCQVKKLNLRNTGIIFGSLNNFHHVTDIEEIDLSGNKMDTAAVSVLSPLVKNSTTLKKIVLDNCSLSADSLNSLCLYISCQKGPMTLSIANNGDISKGLGKEFGACAERIVEFNMSGARMKEQHFNDLLTQLISFKGLKRLFLNNAVEKLKTPQSTVNSLSLVIQNGLEELAVSDALGKVGICMLLEKVPNDCSLQKLDFSENQLGDDGIAYVCEWLRDASCVQSINLDNNRLSLNGLLEVCTVFSVNHVLNDVCIENDFLHEVSGATGLARKRLMQAMTRMMLSQYAQNEKEHGFWMSNCESALFLPTPTQQNALPPAPSFFSEKKTAAEQPVSLPGGLTTMQIDSLEVEPQRERKAPLRTTHKAVIASRVQSTSHTPMSPTQPPTLNAPPSLGVPPSLGGAPSLKAPPMLSIPGSTPEPAAARTSPSSAPARRPAAVAKRSTARRPAASSGTPRASLARPGGHSSRNFEPTVELQRELDEEAAVESPRAEEPDPDMPALQPVAPALPARGGPRPQRQAPRQSNNSRPLPEPEPEPEEEEEEAEPASPQTPSTPTRRMLIGNNRQSRGTPRL